MADQQRSKVFSQPHAKALKTAVKFDGLLQHIN
jgi:hypothetical protein